jgi:glyoxylase-like metal-dependent hydrolase (beta-lactamase superfamily II)
VVAWPDGVLGDYLTSLDRLSELDRITVLPGHGPVLPDCGAIAREYRAHREDRLRQVRAALAAGATTPSEVVALVYPDLDSVLVPAAEWTVRAALAYLEARP